MARDIPQVSVLYDMSERLAQCKQSSDNSLTLSVDGVLYHVPYDEIDSLTDDEIELVREMNSKDAQAIELVRTTDEPLPFISDYNKDLALKSCEFDWSGNVWSRTGRLRKLVKGGNGYLQIENVGIHRRLYAEFLARVNGRTYSIERVKWLLSDRYQVHHMTGKHSTLRDNCLSNLKLVEKTIHQQYTWIIRRLRDEIRNREKVGVLI